MRNRRLTTEREDIGRVNPCVQRKNDLGTGRGSTNGMSTKASRYSGSGYSRVSTAVPSLIGDDGVLNRL
jgi:hypothetical protein